MQFLNVASEAWFELEPNIHAETKCFNKDQMAFKESPGIWDTWHMKKMLVNFYFVMPIIGWKGFKEITKTNLGSESSPSKIWPEPSASFSQIPTTHWMISHPKTSALETSQHQSKGKNKKTHNESKGWWKQSIFSSILTYLQNSLSMRGIVWSRLKERLVALSQGIWYSYSPGSPGL